jgi:hypothetical protein
MKKVEEFYPATAITIKRQHEAVAIPRNSRKSG